jgi:hypothetical protein
MTAKLSITSAAPETETWCAIPVYNNAATIVDVARRARAQLPHVLVIDDGSTDADLRDLLKDIEVTVIRHPENRGKGASLATGFDAAAQGGARYLVTLDGDGQHFPEDIPKFFPHLSSDAILIGSRDDVVGDMPPSSTFGRDFSDFWIGVETGVIVHDTQSGFRIYPVKHVRDLPVNSRHYNFEMEIITRALWAGLHVESVPVRVFYPDQAKRVSSFDPIRDNARIALLHTKLVLRELLPAPHRSIITGPDQIPVSAEASGHASWMRGILSPLGLAASVFVATMFGIILWPWGPIPTIFVAGRLHLNKAAALFVIALTTLPFIPTISLCVADRVLGPTLSQHPHWRWFVGSHIVAFIVAPVLTLLVYFMAKLRMKSA